MIFTFYHMDEFLQKIKETLIAYLQTNESKADFYLVPDGRSWDLTECPMNREETYLIFYRISVPYEVETLKKLIGKHKIEARLIALCNNYEEGILAVANGSDYALPLPLQTKNIIKCCQRFY